MFLDSKPGNILASPEKRKLGAQARKNEIKIDLECGQQSSA
jgi:hypothetical protein